MKNIFPLILILSVALLSACTQAPTTTTTTTLNVVPSLTVSDQVVVDGRLTVAKAVSTTLGWIVIHADNNGNPGDVIGITELNPGENTNVVVEIDAERATSKLHAMLHVDTGNIGVYEFPGNDLLATARGDAVVQMFTVSGLPTTTTITTTTMAVTTTMQQANATTTTTMQATTTTTTMPRNTTVLEGFCGWSTNATCSSDSNCTRGGCSSQVCEAVGEGTVTTCEYLSCYNASTFNVSCGCVNGRCQWYK